MILCQNDAVTIDIRRSKIHPDKTGNLTPLVATISSKDQTEKVRAVDLVCVVDVSGSMYGDNIELVKESLSYLVNLMSEQDNLAIVQFESDAKIVSDFLPMTEENKLNMTEKINELEATGGTNIFSGLKLGLTLFNKTYSNGDRVASMILLSDGQDNYGFQAELFKDLIISENKSDYLFTLHSFGYGDYHDAKLMYDVSMIKDGGYFFIKRLSMVQDAFLKIYGSLSTNCEINVQLKIVSNYEIKKVYGIEYMNEPKMTNDNKTFTTKLIQFIYGKNYPFVFLVDIPIDTAVGTEILTVEISPFGKSEKYKLDVSLSSIAYEEYIRCISFTYFIDAFNLISSSYDPYYYSTISNGTNEAIELINEGITWIKNNYEGKRNWEEEFNAVIEDLRAFGLDGMANLLSKIRELTTTKLGIHYNDNENSFIVKIIETSHNVDLTGLVSTIITSLLKINFESGKNYYYFNLKDGIGEINNLHFSGSGSSFIYYSDDENESINIKPLTNSLEYYNSSETMNKIKAKINFMQGGKFIIKKDFPFAFYTPVDGTKDVTFNIQFLSLVPNLSEKFTILAYVIDKNKLENDYEPSGNEIGGDFDYDDQLKLGKIIIKKGQISPLLSSTSESYLYVIVKPENSNSQYTKVEGQCTFVTMDNIFSSIPEGFYIYSNLESEQKTPHLYSLKMEPELGKNISIEFSNPSGELDAKLLTYKNYPIGSEELYSDYSGFKIERTNSGDKTIMKLKQASQTANTFNFVIVSIFPKNDNHVAGNDVTKLAYKLNYTTESDYGITEMAAMPQTEKHRKRAASSFLSIHKMILLLLFFLY